MPFYYSIYQKLLGVLDHLCSIFLLLFFLGFALHICWNFEVKYTFMTFLFVDLRSARLIFRPQIKDILSMIYYLHEHFCKCILKRRFTTKILIWIDNVIFVYRCGESCTDAQSADDRKDLVITS